MMKSITRFLFVTTQVAAIVFIATSYAIAVYSTLFLSQPFPVTELSSQIVTTLLGNGSLKVLENIFEHNNSPFFGHTKEESE